MKDFKFLKTTQYDTEYIDIDGQMIGVYSMPVGQNGRVYTSQQRPPYGISNRHWNLLPQHLREATEQEMLCYIQGWEDGRNNNMINPYHDMRRAEIWNSGFWDCHRRTETRNTDEPI